MNSIFAMRELSIDALEGVSAGAPVPGGSVTKRGDGSTIMTFNNGATITVGRDGTLSTTTSGGSTGGAHPA